MLGVLGGMGPLATADFLAKLALLGSARGAHGQVPVIAWSVPQEEDHARAILEDGPSPLPCLTEGIQVLQGAGAKAIVLVSNSAHHWHETLQQEAIVPILHIAEAAANALKKRGQGRGVLGLLATEETIASGIYQRRLDTEWGGLVLPPTRDQALLRQAAERVIAGDVAGAAALADPVGKRLFSAGANLLLIGSCELQIAFARSSEGLRAHLIDTTAALAAECLEWAYRKGAYGLPEAPRPAEGMTPFAAAIASPTETRAPDADAPAGAAPGGASTPAEPVATLVQAPTVVAEEAAPEAPEAGPDDHQTTIDMSAVSRAA
jgi:aspartate racemase